MVEIWPLATTSESEMYSSQGLFSYRQIGVSMQLVKQHLYALGIKLSQTWVDFSSAFGILNK